MAPHRTVASVLLALLIPSLAVAQTAGPYPTLLYTTDYSTGSLDPSLTAAVQTGAAPALSLLDSSGSDSETAAAPTFQTTATVGPTAPSEVLTSFTFTSGSPGIVLSSNTRPYFTASGTINVSTSPMTPTLTTGVNAAGRVKPLEWRGAWGLAVTGAAGALIGALLV